MTEDDGQSIADEGSRKTARRKFGREVAGIVLGVLIALAIGEVAEWMRWQVRAAYSNAAIDAELRRVAGVMDERVMVQSCLDRRLEQLDRVVRAARGNNLLPAIGEIGRPPSRPVQTAAWDDAVGSGTLLHLNAERRSGLSVNYPLIAEYPNLLGDERELWATLSILEGAPGRIPDDMLTEASVAIARLRQSSPLNGIVAQQLRDSIVANVGAPSYFLILDREGTRAEIAGELRSRAVCQPLAVRSAN